MICWSCEREAGGAVTCGACGALQPPQAGADAFSVLGVPRRHDLDVVDLESRYKELSRKVHPDRFAKADPRARRASLERTVQLNEAWRALKDPVRRAEALLELAGVKIGADAAPPALLMETLELREELAEARLEGDDAKVASLASIVGARAAQTMKSIASGLAGGRPEQLDEAARALGALRYYRRFLDEVAAHEEAAAVQREEAGSGGG